MRKEDGMMGSGGSDEELERALRSVKPTGGRVDGVTAAFEAGSRSKQRAVRVWQGVAGVILIAGIGSWAIPLRETGTREVHVVNVQEVKGEPSSEQSVWRLQQAVNAHGMAGLPATDVPSVRAMQIDGI